MINVTSYDTTLGSAIPVSKIADKIVSAIKQDPKILELTLGMPGVGHRSIFITDETASEPEVPLYAHPIQVIYRDTTYIATDLRLCLTKRPHRDHDHVSNGDVEARVRDQKEYRFAKSRHAMQLLWADGEVNEMGNATRWAAVLFGGWLADSLQRAMALNFQEVEEVRVVAMMYYFSLFSQDGERETIDRNLIHVTKAVRLDSRMVFEIWDRASRIEDFQYGQLDTTGLVKMLSVGVTGGRLRDLSVVLFLNIIRNSWYGNNAKEILTVALEHPPTWLALAYAALNDRSYKTTAISRVAERLSARGAANDFEQSFEAMIRRVQQAPM